MLSIDQANSAPSLPFPSSPPSRRMDPDSIARDVALMSKINQGDQEAFSTLHRRHAVPLARILRRMLGSLEEAEEIVQEAFLQLWQQADRFRPERASPRGWLLLLARSRALDRIRSYRARERREEAAHRQYFSVVEWIPNSTTGLEAKERSRRLGDAMQGLSEVQRRCLKLSFFDDLSHRQIAQRLDQPLGTVKSRILLGMKKMRLALAEAA